MLLGEMFKKTVEGEVGIEVEQEFQNYIDPFDSNTWTTHEDGSLRNAGYEYVTKKPIHRTEVEGALTSLATFLKKHDKINDHNSPRTSIHIHINTLDCTPQHVWSWVFAYWLLDTLMVELCGIYRVTNLFCLRLRDATNILGIVENELMFTNYPHFDTFNGDGLRYSSQNLMALYKFRSIEYRAKGGRFNPDDTKEWIEALLAIKDAAKEFNTPADIISYYFSVGPNAFARKFLTNAYYNKVVGIDKYQDKMLYNARLLMMLAGKINWDKILSSKNDATFKYYSKPKKEAKMEQPLNLENVMRANNAFLQQAGVDLIAQANLLRNARPRRNEI